MKSVLENVRSQYDAPFPIACVDAQPEPLQNLSNLVKAQLIYFSTAAETLSVSCHEQGHS